jgi:NSS family neurotransmitter:Na+ symporter
MSLAIVTIVLLGMATPSALNLQFLINQDFVWGVALILSGLFFSLLIIQYGVEKFRDDFLSGGDHDWPVRGTSICIPASVSSISTHLLITLDG